MSGLAKLTAAALLVVGATVVSTTAASAAVTLAPTSAQAGSTVDLTFTVTTDATAAPTKSVQVLFPGNSGVTSAHTPAKTGWSPTVEQGNTDVTSVQWDAEAPSSVPTEDFTVTVAIPRTTSEIDFGIVQTHADGKVDRFTDVQDPSKTPTAHPGVVLTVTGATPTTTARTTTTTAATANSTATTKKAHKSLSPGFVLILIGGAVGLVVFAKIRIGGGPD